MKAFLLAAGKGTRLRPYTDYNPKCLIPIRGKPLLEIWFDLLEGSDITEVLVNTHHHADRVEQFIEEKGPGRRLQVLASRKPELLGSAGTLWGNRGFVSDSDDFLIAYADNLTDVDLRSMVNFHGHCKAKGGVLTTGPLRSGPRSPGYQQSGHLQEAVNLPILPGGARDEAIDPLGHALPDPALGGGASRKHWSEAMQLDLVRSWYVLHTKSRFENVVSDGLARKSIEAFLPKHNVRSKRRDRKAIINVPLFAGYVFVKASLDPYERVEILKTAGVVRMIGNQQGPIPVPSDTVESLQIMVATNETIITGRRLRRGDRVIVLEGAFAGVIGVFARYKGQDRVIVNIEALGQTAIVDVSEENVELMPKI